MLDRLLEDSKLYTKSQDYRQLLDFVVKLRPFAPFNAMLLQIQKPGVSYAASASDWKKRFGRAPKAGVRPLLIMWPFGPVALVYDVMDTDGQALPEDVAFFPTRGPIELEQMKQFCGLVEGICCQVIHVDSGDAHAGSIEILRQGTGKEDPSVYRIQVNKNHEPPTQFATLVHELGHLFLGHLGPDLVLKIRERGVLKVAQRELEAESVAYLVCARNGVTCKSESYLSTYAAEHNDLGPVDVYQVMRAAGRIEELLGLTVPVAEDDASPKIHRLEG